MRMCTSNNLFPFPTSQRRSEKRMHFYPLSLIMIRVKSLPIHPGWLDVDGKLIWGIKRIMTCSQAKNRLRLAVIRNEQVEMRNIWQVRWEWIRVTKVHGWLPIEYTNSNPAVHLWSIRCIGLYLNRVNKLFGPISGQDAINRRLSFCFFPYCFCTGARAGQPL